MSEQTGELTIQFAPSLPKKKDFGNVALETSPKTTERGVQELFDLLLDRTELQIDIHRQAQKLTEEERTKLKQDSTDQDSAVNQPTIEHQVELIKSGQMRIPNLSRGITAKEVSEDALSENKKKLKEVQEKVQVLMQNGEVVEGYNNLRKNRVRVLRETREVRQGQSTIGALKLQQEKMARQIFLQKRKYSPGEEAIIKRNQLFIQAIESRVDDLKSDPEVFDQARVRQLQEYQKGLKTDRFAETPTRRKLLGNIRRLWAEGKKVLATGPTGGGKTELFKHASLSMFGEKAEIVGGHELITPYEIYGKMGSKTIDGKTQLGFVPGPLVRAIDKNRPVIIDEINLIPNKVLMRLKPDMNARIGQSITVQEENGVEHLIREKYAFGGTANVKSEKHPDREKLDPALVRMFESVYVDYFPKHELYDVMLASQMDVKGGLRLSSRDDLDAMADLCVATEWIQRAYQGKEVVTNLDSGEALEVRGGASTGKTPTLREAVLDPGKAMDMLSGWEDARIRGMTLREFVNQKIVSFVNNENFPEDDRYYLVEIFALRRFLRGANTGELHISGLDQGTLDAWNGFNGKKVVATDYYVRPDIVAKLDPFGILKRSGGSEVDDLLEEDELAEFETKDESASFTSPDLKPAGRGRSPDAAGRMLIDVLDSQYPPADLPTDWKSRYQAYPSNLVQVASKNPSVHREIVERFSSILDNASPDSTDLGYYVERLSNFAKNAVKSDPTIAIEIGKIIKKINDFTSWQHETEVRRKMEELGRILIGNLS